MESPGLGRFYGGGGGVTGRRQHGYLPAVDYVKKRCVAETCWVGLGCTTAPLEDGSCQVSYRAIHAEPGLSLFIFCAARQSERAGADFDVTGCASGAKAATLLHVPMEERRGFAIATSEVIRPTVPGRSPRARSVSSGFLLVVRQTEADRRGGKLIVVYYVSRRFV